MTDDELNDSFLRIGHKMTKMCQEKGTVKYLRKDNWFFSDIVRNGIHYLARYPVTTFIGRVDE